MFVDSDRRPSQGDVYDGVFAGQNSRVESRVSSQALHRW